MHIDERAWGWVYQTTAGIALLVALLLPSARSTVPPQLRRRYVALQVITLLGAITGAKLAMLACDLGWPGNSVDLDHALFSGKSLVGGLLGGFLSAELAKPFFAWREPPNDWFACKLMISIAIGRLGCILCGCCRGLPTTSRFAIVYSDGVPRLPVTTLEATFHALLFVGFWRWQRQKQLRGRLFGLYLVLYGVFRAATEPLRETPKLVAGYSGYQLLAVFLVAAGVWSLLRQVPEPALDGTLV
ncbi:MAG TPA: prolipoprotein diacylglyceryl transferase family protein [Polyangiaceae bacterium]|jgi:phosphatidylglycerol:prolipoprotein diacylglycerol transferase|nr:prolipoprotein diacylglyceryl transferase family protein [Polyangiaceae bacterium]